MKTCVQLIAALLLLMQGATASADYKEDVDFTKLQSELGSALPTADGFRAIQVEAEVEVDGVKTWMPNPNDSQFSGKDFIFGSGQPSTTVYSGHATSVGRTFYGDTASIAPGIEAIEAFAAGYWLQQDFLWTGYSRQPEDPQRRVANHSWVAKLQGDAESFNGEVLRRIDWVVETYESVQAVGAHSLNPLLSSGFNVIAVGRTSGENGSGTFGVDAPYTAGRVIPHVVAPSKTVSGAVPIVSASAALLIETGQRYCGVWPCKAQRCEVIKAALMAGADRRTNNTTVIDDRVPNITDYGPASGNGTSNGLDKRYGAGQVNIYNSYHIVAAGEQNSLEDEPSTQGIIGQTGFDYEDSFGGLGESNSTATYHFSLPASSNELVFCLAWNIDIDGGSWHFFDGAASLKDFDLLLSRKQDGVWIQVAASQSLADNTENLWIPSAAGGEYMLQVVSGSGQGVFEWDYALAWRMTSEPVAAAGPSPGSIAAAGTLILFVGMIALKITAPQTCKN